MRKDAVINRSNAVYLASRFPLFWLSFSFLSAHCSPLQQLVGYSRDAQVPPRPGFPCGLPPCCFQYFHWTPVIAPQWAGLDGRAPAVISAGGAAGTDTPRIFFACFPSSPRGQRWCVGFVSSRRAKTLACYFLSLNLAERQSVKFS